MDIASLPIQGEASGILRAMRTFEFVFCLIMMDKVMKVTEVLCQAVQRKNIDIGEAMKFVQCTKEILQDMRDDGWDDLVMVLAYFCEKHDIVMPDMSARWFDGTGRPCQQKNFITNEHHFHVEVFNAVLDFQLSELNKRFNDRSCELLMLTSTLDPHDKFSLFETQEVLLAKNFYPQDFMHDDLLTLELECAYYKKDMNHDVVFHTLDSLSDLCRLLVQRRKLDFDPMIYRLICLVLTLPISTATTERDLSSMNIIKNKLRNKIEDDFLDDCMVLHIEKEFAEEVDNDYVIQEFEALATPRVKFS
ncbi:uncharacterized protein LOC126804252 [Argentina anserina]|uniref:uncharacterized protein LOC126804252 n=1 Tax=Argentina anserina TaxID=57926 RepID=UPI0021768598|nr:uncharacterized protein LOC126804252 [Potentilla anserina]